MSAILLVDDSRTHRESMGEVLAGNGFSVLGAASMREAFRILESSVKVDLVMLDIEMPVMDGINGCRVIKSKGHLADLPVIMVTVRADEESLNEAFEAGAMDYITKPPRTVELLARVNAALKLKKEMDRRKAREKELRKALCEVKTLSGLLPLCANCKKIRDDKGYWNRIEEYLKDHLDATISHSLCPECARALYPEIHIKE